MHRPRRMAVAVEKRRAPRRARAGQDHAEAGRQPEPHHRAPTASRWRMRRAKGAMAEKQVPPELRGIKKNPRPSGEGRAGDLKSVHLQTGV